MSVAAVVLAAGSSRRLGRPKQTVEIGGETLLARAVRVAREAGFAPVIVVVADRSLLASVQPAVGCLNEEASEGMASSIRCGVRAVEAVHAAGVVVMACDQVGLTAEHLRLLVVEPERVTASGYAGRLGVPAYFPAGFFGELMLLTGDVGARELLRGAASVCDERLAVDVDTEDDVRLAERVLG